MCVFFKQKTAYEMRISDWSSVVCSSDLRAGFVVPRMGIQFGRGASVAMATLCFYVGVQLMPLADVTAVQFVSPVFVALLSPLMLSERTPVVAWVSTLVAMTGVMTVLTPNPPLGNRNSGARGTRGPIR